MQGPGQPWAYADPNYQWEWEWDAESGAFKDTAGNLIKLPKMPTGRATSLAKDIISRGFMTKKIILENETDAKVRMMFGGEAFDFGENVKQVAGNLD